MKKITLLDALSIGIGGMVGGGIFAVLGLAVSLSKGATPIAFLIAGANAWMTSYAYAELSLKYPSKGGTVTFINKAFGKSTFSGGTNNLLWLSYVIMLSLYASAFGAYAPNLLKITGTALDTHIYASGIILLATLINYYNVKVVSAIEKYAVILKLIILSGFILVGLYGLTQSNHLAQLAPSNYPSIPMLLVDGMVIFVAYEGFELIANVSPDIVCPEKNIRKAFLGATGFVIVLYILIAIITVGSLSFDTIATAEDYVLAKAAEPLLGQSGFVIITIAALISTFSAINASLYGGSRVNYEIAVDDEMPHEFTKYMWNQPIGLFITALLTLVITNTLDLTSISTAGSAGFLLIFAVVNLSAVKLCQKKTYFMIASVVCMIALIALILEQYTSNKLGALTALLLIFITYLTEWIFKTFFEKGVAK